MFSSIPRVCLITFCDPEKNVLLDSISLIFPLPNLAASSSNSIYFSVHFFPLIFDEVHLEHPGFLVSKNADGGEVEREKKAERLFDFKSHFLPGSDSFVQMLLS